MTKMRRSSDCDDTVSVIEDPTDVAVPRAPALMDAFRAMDDVDVERIFTLRASESLSSFMVRSGTQ